MLGLRNWDAEPRFLFGGFRLDFESSYSGPGLPGMLGVLGRPDTTADAGAPDAAANIAPIATRRAELRDGGTRMQSS